MKIYTHVLLFLNSEVTQIDTILLWKTMSYSSCINHYCDVIMGMMASKITSLMIVHSTVYSGADQRKHLSSASLAFVQGIHRSPVNSPHKWPVKQNMFPFDDVIMDDTAAHDLVMQGSRASAAMTQFSHNIAPLEPERLIELSLPSQLWSVWNILMVLYAYIVIILKTLVGFRSFNE